MGKFTDLYKSFLFRLKRISNFKIILLIYFLIVIVSSLILLAPISQTGRQNIEYIDALFVASSAFSDTGLSPIITAQSWSMFGQAIIAVLIVCGGIGIFALKFYIFNIIFRKPVSLTARNILDKERGSQNLGNSYQTIKISVSVMFCLIILFSFILSFVFYYGDINLKVPELVEDPNFVINNPQGDIAMSIRFAVFHTISAINNAGFDIVGSSSLRPYYSNYAVQIIFIILFVTGGIGYPVLFDVFSYFQAKMFNRRAKFKFTTFTKLSSLTYLLISITGIIIAFSFEASLKSNTSFWNSSHYGDYGQKSMALFFNSMSTRNAGFATVNMKDLSEGTIIAYSIMMFIGSAPSSTAGGIRTTTFALVILSIVSKFKHSPSVKVFKRRINQEVVSKAKAVFAISTAIIFLATIFCYSTIIELNNNLATVNQFHFTDILFEVSSSFGTTGLSRGITSSLNIFSKLVLIIVMFIGQLGISSTILVWNENKNKEILYNYVSEDILIG